MAKENTQDRSEGASQETPHKAEPGGSTGASDHFADIVSSVSFAVLAALAALTALFKSETANKLFEFALREFEGKAIKIKHWAKYLGASGPGWAVDAWRKIPWPSRRQILVTLGITLIAMIGLVSLIIGLVAFDFRSLAALLLLVLGVVFFWLVVFLQSASRRIFSSEEAGNTLFSRPLSIIALLLVFSAAMVVVLPESLRSFPLVLACVAAVVSAACYKAILGQRSNKTYSRMVTIVVMLTIGAVITQGVLPRVAPVAYGWLMAYEERLNSLIGLHASNARGQIFQPYEVIEAGSLIDEAGVSQGELEQGQEVLVEQGRAKKIGEYPLDCWRVVVLKGGKVERYGFFASNLLRLKTTPAEENEEDEDVAAVPQEVWGCPMHPLVRKSAPGLCPICGQDLVAVQNSGAAVATDFGPSMSPVQSIPAADQPERVLVAWVDARPEAWVTSRPMLIPKEGDLVVWGPLDNPEDFQRLQSMVGWNNREVISPAVFGDSGTFIGKTGITYNHHGEPLRFRVTNGTPLDFEVQLIENAYEGR